jgi:hypothetical protein
MKHVNTLHLSHHFWRSLVILLTLLGQASLSFAQPTTLNTTAVTGWANNNGSGTVTFNFENTNAYPIIITGIEGVVTTAGASTAEVWIKTTPISGLPGVISVANGWTQLATGTFTGVASGTSLVTQNFFPGGISVTIPAGVTYGMAIFATTQRYHSMVAPNVPLTTVSGGGCNILMGTNISYGGGAPNGGAPTFTPRGWIGKLTFVPDGPCTDPPVVGTIGSTANNLCVGQSAVLSMSGGTGGTGQTYQWSSSSTSGGPYTPISGATNASFVAAPTSTTYYICDVTCGISTGTTAEFALNVNLPFPGGSYTIDNSQPTGGTNFNSFTAAVAAISCGISGPVIFDVDPSSGPYTEQITLPATIGSTAINTVTFNGNGRTLQFNSADGNNRHVVKFDGADYITFNDLVINCTGGTFGWGMHFINGADYNTVSLCTINSLLNTSSTNYTPVIMSGSVTSPTTAGNSGNYNTFIDNTFNGGYYGATVCGAGVGSEVVGNTFTNCAIRNFYNYGIYTLNSKDAIISTCDFARPTQTATTTAAGVFMTTGTNGTLVENCRIHNFFDAMPTNTSTFYGVYCSADASAGTPNRVINNVVYKINYNGPIYGIYNVGGDNFRAYHNTIAIDNPAATAGLVYGIYQTTAAVGLDYRNNLVTIRRGGTGLKSGLYYNTAGSTIISNHNAVFLNSTTGVQNYGNLGATGYLTLATWQTANGGIYDANSVFADPVYANAASDDYTPTAIGTNNVGTNVGVGFDINGTPRSGFAPDPGAYEYTLSGLDGGISWVSPASPTTVGLKTITVAVTNNLSTPITSLELNYTDGGTPVTETFGSLSLLPGVTQSFSFVTQYTITGNVSLTAFISSVNGGLDDNQNNDTITENICLSLSGAYTINSALPSGGTNFASFTDLASTLSCGGVAGPVTVDVVSGSGPYVEQVTIPAYSGASATNTLTINGNGNTLSFPSGTEYQTLLLSGADYMIWNDMNIVSNGASTTGIALRLTNASDNNVFNDCVFSVPLTITGTGSSSVAFSASGTSAVTAGNNGSFNTFSGCTMSGGYYCVSVYGQSGANIVGNQFVGCTVTDFYLYGVYNVYGTTTIVRDCIFERPNRTTTSTTYGAFLSTGSIGCLIERNRFRNLFPNTLTSTSTMYAMYCSSTAASLGNENSFINNLVHNIQGNGIHAGVYLTSASFVNVFHNTIVHNNAASTAGTTYGIYNSGTSAINIQNNIVHITRGGTGVKHCLYYLGLPTTTNYNVLFMNAPAGTNWIAYDGITDFLDLPAYQTANPTKDINSTVANAGFANPAGGDFKPTNVSIDNIGNGVGVSVDITGATRGTPPDPGAYEFTVAPIDAGVLSFVSPNTSGCYSSTEVIEVVIKNFGSTTLDFSTNPLTVEADVSGPVATVLTATPSGTLAPGATLNVSFPSFNMTGNGTYTFTVSSVISGDGDATNDVLSGITRTVGPVGGTITSSIPSICVSAAPVLSLSGNYGGSIQWQESTVGASGPWTNVGTGTNSYAPGTVTQATWYQVEVSCNGNTVYSNVLNIDVNNPQLIGTTPGTRCGYGSVALGATVNAGNTANWYTNATGGTPIGTGTTFNTPNISSTTTYYAAASSGGYTVNTGLPSALPTATPGAGTTNFGLVFDVLSPFTLTSVDIFPVSASSASGNVTIEVINSSSVVLHSFTVSVTGTPSGFPGVTVPVNFNLQPGTNLKMRPAFSGGITQLLFEPSASAPAGNYGYPHVVPGVLSILTSTLTAAPTNTARNDLYYYFYNWTIGTGCEGSRVPVVATVTPAPSIVASVVDPAICPGGSTSVSVTSSNDPNYTYSWSSAPSGFSGSGAGPLTVAPTNTTKYYVNAVDNTAGTFAGCAAIDSVTVVTASTLTGGTVSANTSTYCANGTPTLTVAGAQGGLIQWQESTVGAGGPWTNVGTVGSTTYSPLSPFTQTTYVRVLVSCATNDASSNVVTITINSPQFLSTTPGSRCGVGTVSLAATANPGTSIRWFTAPSGGAPLFTGSPFTTPTIATTTTYYAEPLEGIGGQDSISATVGTTSGVNHHMFVMSSPTGMTLQEIGIKSNQALGTLTTWEVYYRPDNYQLVPGANTSATGWILLSTATNIPSAGTGANDYTYITVGQNLVIPSGATYSFYIAPATGTTHTYNTTALGATNSSNANAILIGGHRGSALFNCSTSGGMPTIRFKYSLGCAGNRVPVVATINTPPTMTVTAVDPTLCPGGNTTVSVSSVNDPNYTYTWTSNPAGFTANGAGPHAVAPSNTTTYIVSAIDNTAGAFNGCTNVDSVTVITAPALLAGTVSANQTTFCLSGTPVLSLTGSAGGAIQWQESTVSSTGPWTNVGTAGTATSYTPSSALTQTTYYRVEVSCQSTILTSNVVTVTVNNPTLLSTTPGVVCGTSGSTTISATPDAGTTVSWFDVATGGIPLATGNSFTTPVLTNTTTYYAAPSIGGGGTAVATMPAQLSTFSGNVRGYWFTAPADFTITGVTAPGTGGTTQSIAIVKFNGGTPPPTFSVTTNAFTTLFLTQGNSNMGVIPCNVTVAAGDVIGMLGQRDNLTSYGPGTNPTFVTIAGSSVGLTRMGMQFPLTTTAPQDLWQEVTATSSIGRVEFEYTVGCEGTRVPVQVVVGPCNSELNLKLYIQAYWDGTSAMLPVLANQFEPTTANACDSVTVQLRDAITYGVVQSVKTVLNQDGTVACVFPPVSGNYYVAVQHRNAIETWSSNPISISSTPVSYDFTTAANKAYGDNQIEVSTGIWAFYSGDVLKDFAESIDLGDLNQVETEINNFSFGYFAEDLNGDGNVDLGDTPFLEDNINSFIFSNHP